MLIMHAWSCQLAEGCTHLQTNWAHLRPANRVTISRRERTRCINCRVAPKHTITANLQLRPAVCTHFLAANCKCRSIKLQCGQQAALHCCDLMALLEG